MLYFLTHQNRHYLFLAALLLWGANAQAQLQPTSKAQQRAESRRALRDAKRFPAEYKESHLTVTKPELKEGNGGRLAVLEPNDARSSYRFDKSGTPRVSESTRLSLRLRKKDKASIQ